MTLNEANDEDEDADGDGNCFEMQKDLEDQSRCKSKKLGKLERLRLSASCYREFNARIYQGRLPTALEINWNARLTKTAGITRMRRDATGRHALIELSTKVCDTEVKLRETIAHEMCHVADFILKGHPAHGKGSRNGQRRPWKFFQRLL